MMVVCQQALRSTRVQGPVNLLLVQELVQELQVEVQVEIPGLRASRLQVDVQVESHPGHLMPEGCWWLTNALVPSPGRPSASSR